MASASPSTAIHPAHALLSIAHPAPLATSILNDKVLRKPLLLRPTSPDLTSQNARSLRRAHRLQKHYQTLRKTKPRPLSAKEKRKLGVYEIPKEQWRYELYVPLHRLWVGYMREILGLKEGERGYVTAGEKGSVLASADYHGAELEVVRSRCVGRVGTKGIVLRDTKFTFEVITMGNVLKVIPKEHTIFRFEIPQLKEVIENEGNFKEQESLKNAQPPRENYMDAGPKAIAVDEATRVAFMGKEKVVPDPCASLIFELHGDQFRNRATDRATKRFKQRRMDHL